MVVLCTCVDCRSLSSVSAGYAYKFFLVRSEESLPVFGFLVVEQYALLQAGSFSASPIWTRDTTPLDNPPSASPRSSIGHSNFYSAPPSRPCRTHRSINPPHGANTPAGNTGTTNICSHDHRQQGNMFPQLHYHTQLVHCTTLT
jgi:hypothetical protein